MFGSKWEEYYKQNGTGEQLAAGVEEAPGIPGLDWIVSRIREHMEKLGVDSANLCCKVNTRSAIVDRLEFVDNMGLLPPLSGLLGHCGCSSLFPCIYCIVWSHAERAMTLQQWEAAGISMREMEELVQLTHTVMGSRCPSTKCKDRDVTASSAELTDEGMSVSRRQQQQQLHYGMCRGRAPYLVLSHILDYSVDILHLMLRVVPQIFKFTFSKHCDAAKQLELVKWVEEHLKVKLSNSKAGQ
eukprot:jgi/Tetstr1/421036/TSEL_012081.t1